MDCGGCVLRLEEMGQPVACANTEYLPGTKTITKTACSPTAAAYGHAASPEPRAANPSLQLVAPRAALAMPTPHGPGEDEDENEEEVTVTVTPTATASRPPVVLASPRPAIPEGGGPKLGTAVPIGYSADPAIHASIISKYPAGAAHPTAGSAVTPPKNAIWKGMVTGAPAPACTKVMMINNAPAAAAPGLDLSAPLAGSPAIVPGGAASGQTPGNVPAGMLGQQVGMVKGRVCTEYARMEMKTREVECGACVVLPKEPMRQQLQGACRTTVKRNVGYNTMLSCQQ
ncbi:hypothetical protein K402DRAFT_399069 [Aulographum hederae CBS 113979]|uniref:Uncharacterized protein n=1 Tax=Aulographum hederae CBS 113979 TaxID=1176131 RepID=A0A6G1GJF4_9PEZI|nr:hypothetical protein K402DRAFT_399069 [Aulographum hederae CBS 113979]